MSKIHPFIHFNGNAEQAFKYYQAIFGGELTDIVRFRDLTGEVQQLLLPEEADKVMNISLSHDRDILLAGSDVPSFMGRVNEAENRSKISVSAENKEEADHFFNSLSAEGEVEVPMIDNGTGKYFGMLRDKYGVEWMIVFGEI